MSDRLLDLVRLDGQRRQAILFQLPLSLLVAVIAITGPSLRPDLFDNGLFVLSLILHGLLLIACVVIPWDRRPETVLAIPLLDFIAIGLSREGAEANLPGLGILAVFPVIWLASSPYLSSGASLLLTFFCPWLIVLIPDFFAAPFANVPKFAETLLLPVITIAVAGAIRTAAANVRSQQNQLESKDAELRLLLQASNERELLMKTILDTIDVGIMAFDAQGATILANRQQRLLYEMPSASDSGESDESALHVVGRDRKTEIPPERRPAQRARDGESFSDYLIWLGLESGQRALSTTARAVYDASGAYAGSVIAFSDVTELAEAMSAKEEFVSNVSHEFRTPLTSIIGYLDLVLDVEKELAADLRSPLLIVRRNAERLLALVSDLLITASNSMSVHPRPTDIASVIESCVSSAEAQARSAGVTLLRETPDLLWAHADPVRIGQVLDNLISNAIKYSPGGGCITVRAHDDGETVRLEVADTGMGLEAADIPQVFSKFFRSSTARRAAIPGVGLGLSITKTIVENHGGTITCTSEVGVGTTFTVALPADAAIGENPCPNEVNC